MFRQFRVYKGNSEGKQLGRVIRHPPGSGLRQTSSSIFGNRSAAFVSGATPPLAGVWFGLLRTRHAQLGTQPHGRPSWAEDHQRPHDEASLTWNLSVGEGALHVLLINFGQVGSSPLPNEDTACSETAYQQRLPQAGAGNATCCIS